MMRGAGDRPTPLGPTPFIQRDDRLTRKTLRPRVARYPIIKLIWWFYADLKLYQREPCRQRRGQLGIRSDRIFKRRTGFVTLDHLLARLHARRGAPAGTAKRSSRSSGA